MDVVGRMRDLGASVVDDVKIPSRESSRKVAFDIMQRIICSSTPGFQIFSTTACLLDIEDYEAERAFEQYFPSSGTGINNAKDLVNHNKEHSPHASAKGEED